MPRIRKKTSKRGTTHQRAKIKHKVSESRRKAKKAAKKNPQWKSKHKKDPGIPNSFPYKDEILAEIAAQRRQEEEEKRKRKEQRKAEKAAAIKRAGEDHGDDEKQEEQAGEPEIQNAAPASGFDGVSSLSASSIKVTQEEPKSAKGKERTVDDSDGGSDADSDSEGEEGFDRAEDKSDSENEVSSPPPSPHANGKRKRPISHSSGPASTGKTSKPSKKVAFAAHPVGTKQARMQSSQSRSTPQSKLPSAKAKHPSKVNVTKIGTGAKTKLKKVQR